MISFSLLFKPEMMSTFGTLHFASNIKTIVLSFDEMVDETSAFASIYADALL